MTIAHRGLKVKVMHQANVVGPTSIEDSFFLLFEASGLDVLREHNSPGMESQGHTSRSKVKTRSERPRIRAIL